MDNCSYTMASFKIFGVVNEQETYYCHDIAQKIADYSTQSISIEFAALLQVDYLNKVEELKKLLATSLIHYNKNHIVVHNNSLVGDVNDFIEFSRSVYEIEPDGMNTIVCNRNVRERTYEQMSERGRPIVYLEFIQKATHRDEVAGEWGKVFIEL